MESTTSKKEKPQGEPEGKSGKKARPAVKAKG